MTHANKANFLPRNARTAHVPSVRKGKGELPYELRYPVHNNRQLRLFETIFTNDLH